MTRLPGVRAAFREVDQWLFGPADPRAYALLRTGYALSVLCILVDFWPDRQVLLAASGLFGGAAPGRLLSPPNVFAWCRTEPLVTAVFLLAGAAAVCLALGVLTRAASIVTYVWAVSCSTTAPIAQSGFDSILRVVGFALVISPTIAGWRQTFTDSATPERAPPAYGLRLVQWQLMLIYVSTVWLKAPDPFWRSGEAVPYFMMSMFSRFPGTVFAHLGPLGALLTYSTLLIEASVPFLLWMRRTRWLGVFLGVALHAGIAVGGKLLLFTLAILPMYAAFLERHDFERIASWLKPASSPLPGT